MSLKVWTAYRVRRGFDVWEVMRDIRRKAEHQVQRELTRLYDALVKDFEKDGFHEHAARLMYLDGVVDSVHREKNEEFTKKKVAEGGWGYADASNYVSRRYKRAAVRPEKDAFDLDVSVSVRELGGRHYLIPYPGSGVLRGSLDFLRKHTALEDYHYQNQVDRPRSVSPQEWGRRRKVWEYLTRGEVWADYLALEVLTVSNFWQVCPYWAGKLARRDVVAYRKTKGVRKK